ncbi:hypothetical protein [Actibacterium sp. XHP0104]|uniref:hypothetical protein n=1 Tax=Actibacterium sp. XHP0104 TaxID=2984335 RepID=UPI0021E8911C|nr:hypothetical protein [Actibacterium sp. XHP0104]MCV2883014.1 hypothetical protein [Actibacterium sp. XHP0104]
MTTILITYAILSLGILAILTAMILRIGGLMADCPDTGPATRVATVSVATGFAAIGGGGVLLVGALLVLLPNAAGGLLPIAMGLAALCLGLGFTNAVATLRGVVTGRPAEPVKEPASSIEGVPV